MKMIMTNIRTLAALLVASATFVACSNEDKIIEEDSTNDGYQVYTITIDANINGDDAAKATTRALAETTDRLASTWGSTDKVAAFNYTKAYAANLMPATTTYEIMAKAAAAKKALITGNLKPENESIGKSSAKLTGELTGNIESNEVLYLIYPYQDISDAASFASAKFTFEGQDGTLATIASKYDYRLGKAKVVSVDGSTISAVDAIKGSGPIKFEAKQAIVKFILIDENGDPINATGIDVGATNSSTHENDLVTGINLMTQSVERGELTIYDMPGTTNEIWIALNGVNNSDFFIIAYSSEGSYEFSKNGVTFENGKFYEIRIKMNQFYMD